MHAAATVGVLQICGIFLFLPRSNPVCRYCHPRPFPKPCWLGAQQSDGLKNRELFNVDLREFLESQQPRSPCRVRTWSSQSAASLMKEKVEHLYSTVEDTAGYPLCWHSLNSCMICILLPLQQLRHVQLNNTHKQAARIKCISSVGCSMTFRVFLLSSSTPVISSPHCLCPTQTACHRASSSSQNKGANNSRRPRFTSPPSLKTFFPYAYALALTDSLRRFECSDL